ncbi:Hypothetical predicted protein [Mytilus galloprovincialis]|uniref:Uncharacterized protein n=1 Tax=Mytilus galloprovincialis TaxID=29158 RepID=A0A8B6BVS7_MYTGA|nr:Hypothetical predicted protein [Mytilus galloprovincialis]
MVSEIISTILKQSSTSDDVATDVAVGLDVGAFFIAIFLSIFLSCFERNKRGGRPGIVIPINFLQDDNLAIVYTAAFGCTSIQLLNLIFRRGLVLTSFNIPSLVVPWVRVFVWLIMALYVSLKFYPVFAVIRCRRTIIEPLIGLFYTAFIFTSLIYQLANSYIVSLSLNKGFPMMGWIRYVECLSMRFEEHWKSDLDFDLYVEELKNQSMVGRQWLLPILESKLNQPNTGIFLTADMGFGKSSIVSNIICANHDSVWHKLKKRVLAYHMCRYDVISSSKPDIFIKNLAGIIVKKIPELGNSILSDDRALDFLYSARCREDPVGCLEFSLLNPLKNDWKERSYIIIIDAIDECQTAEGHSLHDLLYKKMHFFPNNVKFFITSRNIEQITNKFKNLDIVSLDNYTQENLKDVRSYIDKTRKLTDKEVTKLTKVSGGNFLHVKLFLHYCIQKGSCNYDYMPDTLERIYVLNFERVFREKGLFEEFMDIFAVLCSLQHPIEEDKLLEVSGMNTNTRVRARQILGNELGHFLKISDGRLSFQHKSLVDFLTNSSRKHLNFYIDNKRGHKLFAKFLLQSLNLTESNSLLEVVHHVALSKDVDFEVLLINHAKTLNHGQHVIHSELLFNVVREYDSYDTVQLTIKLIKLNSSNVNEEVLSLSAFIAIANEHEESLRACLEKGANINYVHDPLVLPATGDLTYICKYIYFCKYSLLHLTAQKGYLKIAEALLEKQISLLYLNNSLGLNAFQLAAEHGHISIMKLFLKYNSSLVDFYSLYQSALQGEYKAVKLQLGYVDDVCMPCTVYPILLNIYGSLLQYNVTSKTSRIRYQMVHYFENRWIANQDNLFRCETALNAAIRNGHIKIVKLLLKNSNKTLNCPSIDGSFPLMTAVMYNQTEIFKLLYEAGANEFRRCNNIQNFNLTYRYLIADQTFYDINITYFKQSCPPFGGIDHLVSIYDNLAIMHLIHEKGYHSWSSEDIDGLTPIHYAFCHNSINFLNYIVLRNRFPSPLSNLRSNNGSTPFHSAAICKSIALFHYFNPNKNNEYNFIPDVLDNENRSILQYAFLQPLHAEDLVKIDYIGHDAFTSSLLHVLELSKHNVLHRDIYGRNFLHYASSSGNYFAFVQARNSKVIGLIFDDLLQQKDFDERTSFETAFEDMPEHNLFEPFKMPNNCSLNDMFSSSCKTNLSILLSPHEYVILYLAQYFHSQNEFSHVNITHLLITSIKKSRIYPILTLKVYASDEFRTAISNPVLSSMISESPTPFLAEHMLDIYSSLFCNGSESPLHKIVQNERNRQWRFSSYTFLDRLFVKFSSIYLDNCYDKDGYNLLHRSVIGGHPTAVKYLLEKGMNVLQKSKANQSALTLSILFAPYTRNGSIPSYYTNSSRFHSYKLVYQTETADILFDHSGTVNFDDIASILLMHLVNVQFNRNSVQIVICSYHIGELGLIHIASAKGMLSFLKSSKELFGDEILKCQNKYGVTPLYLADMYRQTNIVQWLEKMNCAFYHPDKASEVMIIFNLLDNYETHLLYDRRCFANYEQAYKALIRNQIFKCIGKDVRLPIMFQNPTKNIVFNMLYAKMSADFCKSNWEWFKKENFYSFLLQYHLTKKTNNQVYNLYRPLLLFGSDDRRYIFHLLFILRTSARGTLFDPVSDSTVKTLFDSISSNQYKHLRKLKMAKDLHRSWLTYEIHELKDDLNIVMYKNYEVENLNRILKNQTEVSDAELILTNKANKNCYDCRHSHAMCFTKSLIQQLSNIKTYEQLNRNAMLYIPECNYMSPPTMKMLSHNSNTTLKFIADLQAPDKNKFKSLVIELELLVKRTLKMIFYFPETENANIQPYELFYYSPFFHGFYNCINDLQLYNMIKCTKLYAKNEHLKIYRTYLTILLHVLEREFEYGYHI